MYFPTAKQTILSLFVLISTPVATITAETLDSAAVLQQAPELAHQHRFTEAETLLERANKQAVAEGNEYYEARIQNLLGLTYFKESRYVLAQGAFDRSLALLTRLKGENSRDLLEPLNNLGQLFYESGENPQAEKLILRNIAIRSLGKLDADMGTELGMLGKVYLVEQRYAQAKETAERALQVLKETGEPEGMGAALAYSVLGSVYDRYRENQGAEQALQRSLEILQKSLDPADYRIGEGMANLGLFYAQAGRKEKAEPLFEKAHGFFHSNSVNTLFNREFLSTWADLERKSGNKKKASELIREARSLNAQSAQNDPSRYTLDANSFR